MDATLALVTALGVLGLVSCAFFAVFRGRGTVRIDTKLGKLAAEGENPLPTHVPSGVSAEGAIAGANLRALSTAQGGITAKDAQAGADIELSHSPSAAEQRPR